MKLSGRPSYNLHYVKRLVSERKVVVRRRALAFPHNRYEQPLDTLLGVFDALRPEDFRKTMELAKAPGVMADVYHPQYDGTTWYVKFYIDEETPCVDVWSCNWDSCLH